VAVPAGGNATFDITIDARAVPLGQVRHAYLELRYKNHTLHLPITIVRRQAVALPFEKTCAPATFPVGGTSTCTVTATNTSFDTAQIQITDTVPDNLAVQSVTGGTLNGNTITFSGSLAGVQPPNVAIGPGASPAGGYVPLSAFGIPAVSGFGDETIVNFDVPAFTYAGATYSRVGVTSNGYVVVGGGTSADVRFDNQNLPNPAAPNNVLAPFWTDLNPASGGAIRIATLSDGSDTWIVVDYNAVREFSQPRTATFEIWIGVNGDGNPGEDISFAYGGITGNGDGGLLTVGAENLFGNRGQNAYFNGSGTLPANGTQLRVTGTPGGPGGTHTITFTARGVKAGAWTNYAYLTSNLLQGTSVAFFGGRVTK
jgi:uncharacterized repeat protein (TIGR01451 family)